MQIVLNTPIMDAIIDAYTRGAMVAGTSAGAAVMSEKMITGSEKRYPDYNDTFRTIETGNIDLAPGLGLINTAIIDQHFVWRSRHNRLISAVLEFPDLLGIGIDESTAILVKGTTAEVVGLSQVLVYKHAGSEINTFGNKPGTTDISLGVYLPGQTFSLR
jgi:cyanophycinase